MAEGGSGAQVIVRQICDTCDSLTDASWFCVDCDQKLCDRCKTSHLKSKKTSNDEIITLKEARRDKRPRFEMCERHKTQICDIYCHECDVTICSYCLDADHKRHNWRMAKDVLPDIVSNIDKLSKELEENLDQYDENFKAEGMAHVRYLNNIDETEKEVKNRVIELQQEVSRIQNEYLANLSNLREKENKRYSDRCRTYHNRTTPGRSTVEKYQTEKLRGNFHDLKLFKIEIQGNHKVHKVLPQVHPPVLTPADNDPTLLHKVLGDLDISSAGVFLRTKKKNNQGNLSTAIKAQGKPLIGITLNLRASFRVTEPIGTENNVFRTVSKICPDEKGGAWLVQDGMNMGMHYMIHIDQIGKVTHQSQVFQRAVDGVGIDRSGQLFVAVHHQVLKLTDKGDRGTVFTGVDGRITALCVSPYGHNVVISFTKQITPSQTKTTISTLDPSGSTTKKWLFTDDVFDRVIDLSVLSTGELVALVSQSRTSAMRVMVFDKDGNIKSKWGGDIWNSKGFKPVGITTIVNDNMFLALYTISMDGSGATHIDGRTFGIYENITSISSDAWGRLWVCCYGGQLFILES